MGKGGKGNGREKMGWEGGGSAVLVVNGPKDKSEVQRMVTVLWPGAVLLRGNTFPAQGATCFHAACLLASACVMASGKDSTSCPGIQRQPRSVLKQLVPISGNF